MSSVSAGFVKDAYWKPLIGTGVLAGFKSPGTSLVAQIIMNLPAIRETWVRSLGWEDPQEEGMATHSSILAWGIPMDRGAWLQPMGS